MESISVQLEPGDQEKLFQEQYLEEAKFEVSWGDIKTYAKELYQATMSN